MFQYVQTLYILLVNQETDIPVSPHFIYPVNQELYTLYILFNSSGNM